MPDLYLKQTDADQEVIQVLIKELNRRNKMSKYFRDTVDGKVYRALDYEEVTPDELQAHVDKLNNELSEANAFLGDSAVAAPATPEEPTPAETPSEPVEEQAAPEAPVEAAQPEQAAEVAAPEQPLVVADVAEAQPEQVPELPTVQLQ